MALLHSPISVISEFLNPNHFQKFNFKKLTNMSKNYMQEHYAINKHSKGIIYRGTDGDNEISLEQFLSENPTLTESDFNYWKSLSDELHKEEDRKNNEITRKNVSINEIEETQLVAVESAETEFIQSISEKDAVKKEIMSAQFILRIAQEELSDIQFRRFLSRYVDGKKEEDIAKDEGVCQSTISRSILGAENKIKKIIRKLCIKNGISDVI